MKVAVLTASPLVQVAEATFKTSTPAETLQSICNWYHPPRLKQWTISYVGVASFGPVELNPADEKYGYITSTPKAEWRDTPLLRIIASQLGFHREIGFNTDVNAAALAEFKLGRHKCEHSLAYVTVGTGIGVGVICDGKILRGLVHTEGGHVVVQRHPKDTGTSVCPFHSFCAEGLSTNVALASRLGVAVDTLETVSDAEEVWEFEAFYLAQVCLNITLLLSPEVIVLGGGVMKREKLLPMVRARFRELLNHYVAHPKLQSDDYIVSPFLANSGMMGAALLALQN